MDGKISAVYAFTGQNGYLGSSGGGSIGAGDDAVFTVAQDDPEREGAYVSVSISDNAVCVAWIAVTQYDSGEQSGAWTGDIGYNCGQYLFYSDESFGLLPNWDEYTPLCTWLDGDSTNGIPSAAMKFATFAYGAQIPDTLANHEACSATIFSSETGPISDQPAGAATETNKRATIAVSKKRPNPVRYAWMEQQLIISNHTTHTAADLSESATSYGPNFVGSDGQYCDMDSKFVIPLCSTSDENGCVEVSLMNQTLTRCWIVAKREIEHVHKSYTTVDLWSV